MLNILVINVSETFYLIENCIFKMSKLKSYTFWKLTFVTTNLLSKTLEILSIPIDSIIYK